MIGLPNCSRVFAYSSATSYAARAMPIAWAPTAGRVRSKVAIDALPPAPPTAEPLAGLGQAGVELLLATEQAAAGHPHLVEDHLGRVRGADAVLVELLPLAEPLGAGRDDEAGLAAGAQVGVDHGRHDVDVGDAAVGRPGLGAVDDPLVGGLVVHRASAHRPDVGAGVRLGGAEGTQPQVTRAAVHLRHPLRDLLVGAAGADRRRPRARCRRSRARSRRHPRRAPPS